MPLTEHQSKALAIARGQQQGFIPTEKYQQANAWKELGRLVELPRQVLDAAIQDLPLTADEGVFNAIVSVLDRHCGNRNWARVVNAAQTGIIHRRNGLCCRFLQNRHDRNPEALRTAMNLLFSQIPTLDEEAELLHIGILYAVYGNNEDVEILGNASLRPERTSDGRRYATVLAGLNMYVTAHAPAV